MAEWKILMISWGESRMGRIINEYIRGKDREARLRWFGFVQRGIADILDKVC